MARWELHGRELKRVDPGSAGKSLSAQAIYSALIDARSEDSSAHILPDGLQLSRYPLVPKLRLQTTVDGTPSYSLEGRSASKCLTLYRADLDRGHVAVDGMWYPIDPDTNNELSELLADCNDDAGPISSLKFFLSLKKAAASGMPVEDLTKDETVSPLAFVPQNDDQPVGVEATLYPYQLSGWRWLKFLLSEVGGGLLADEMGLGKTLQIIALLSDSGGQPLSPSLVVAPGSLLENWRREFEKFAPQLRVLKHHGPFRTGRPNGFSQYDVVVTSYDIAVGDSSLLNMVAWKALVLDEAQLIRNPKAKRTKAIKRLRREASLAVTGTPVENRLSDVWSIIDFVKQGYLGDISSFEQTFGDDTDGAKLLEPLISPLILRRRVAEVAQDLPPRIDIPQILELDSEEAGFYEAERERIAQEYGAAATLVALTSLRRFCAHPSLMGQSFPVSDLLAFSKFRRLDEIVEEIFEKNEKVLIFTSFTAMADLISHHIKNRFGMFVGVIDGRLPIDNRQLLIDEFSAVSGGAALVLNPKAGGAGLNIVAANHVIHYNPEWNPALEDQASARAHRRGQKLPVTVHHLIIADTVEEVVDERLSRKREISSAAVIGSGGKDEDYTDIVTALSRSPSRK